MSKIKLQYNSGDRYGQVMLTGKAYLKDGMRMVEYICDCGNIRWGLLYSLRTGHTKSCGCLHKKGSKPKHGLCRHPLYNTWKDMKQRCYNVNYTDYHNYGGRGIFVCSEWIDNAEAFIKWAELNGYQEGLTLDRIENDKEYSPNNCRFSTRGVQNRNKRTNIFLTAYGETKCVTDWLKDKRCMVSFNTMIKRVNDYGWGHEMAISMGSMRGKDIFKNKTTLQL